MNKLLITIILFLPSLCLAEFTFSAYTPGTIADVISSIDKNMISSDIFIEAANIKRTVLVTYTGKHREANDKLNNFILSWVKALKHNPDILKSYSFEIEVMENTNKYWLPIQNTLTQDFVNEVSPNKQVELYIMLLGGYKNHPVFSINGFQAK